MGKSKVTKIDPKKKFDVLERILLLGLLPKEGSYTNLKLLRQVREALSFSEAENKALNFRQEQGTGGAEMLAWNTVKLINKATGDLVRGPEDVLQRMYAADPGAFEKSAACPPKPVFVGDVVEAIIVKTLGDLDKAGKLTNEHVPLYERFVIKDPGE